MNKLITVIDDVDENRIVILDSDNEFLNDYYYEDDDDHMNVLNELNELADKTENEIVDFFSLITIYGEYRIAIHKDDDRFETYKNNFGNEFINRIGDTYLFCELN